MKLYCELEKIKKAILSLSRITSKKEQNETLSCLFFIIKKNTLIIRATNLSIGAEYKIQIETSSDFEDVSFSINAQNIQNIFSSLILDKNSKNIEIDVKENLVNFTYKKNKLNVKKQPTGDVPTLPDIREESFIIDKQTLKEGIQTVLSTASKSDIKPELASIFINQQEGKLVFVTTDTFRLTEYSVFTKKEYSFPSILIPSKNAQEIYKILEDSVSNDIEVYPVRNQITFVTKDVFITSQLINGVFPDYTKIIPTIKHGTTSFLKSDVLDVLKTLNPFMDIRSQVKMKINNQTQEIEFSCNNDTLGEYNGSISAKVVGDSFDILINKNFFEDILMKMTESVTMIINQPQKPILINSSENKEVLCLLMPMSQ
jgi:DNA polymerase-3 subunit beta